MQIFRTAIRLCGAGLSPVFWTFCPDCCAARHLGLPRLPLGLWRRQFEGFSVLSFLLPVLESVTPHLALEQTDSEASPHCIGDLTGPKVTGWLNELYYKRLAARGQCPLPARCRSSWQCPRRCPPVGEDLLTCNWYVHSEQYRLDQEPAGVAHWVSTA
jgi:hypothetical protein